MKMTVLLDLFPSILFILSIIAISNASTNISRSIPSIPAYDIKYFPTEFLSNVVPINQADDYFTYSHTSVKIYQKAAFAMKIYKQDPNQEKPSSSNPDKAIIAYSTSKGFITMGNIGNYRVYEIYGRSDVVKLIIIAPETKMSQLVAKNFAVFFEQKGFLKTVLQPLNELCGDSLIECFAVKFEQALPTSIVKPLIIPNRLICNKLGIFENGYWFFSQTSMRYDQNRNFYLRHHDAIDKNRFEELSIAGVKGNFDYKATENMIYSAVIADDMGARMILVLPKDKIPAVTREEYPVFFQFKEQISSVRENLARLCENIACFAIIVSLPENCKTQSKHEPSLINSNSPNHLTQESLLSNNKSPKFDNDDSSFPFLNLATEKANQIHDSSKCDLNPSRTFEFHLKHDELPFNERKECQFSEIKMNYSSHFAPQRSIGRFSIFYSDTVTTSSFLDLSDTPLGGDTEKSQALWMQIDQHSTRLTRFKIRPDQFFSIVRAGSIINYENLTQIPELMHNDLLIIFPSVINIFFTEAISQKLQSSTTVDQVCEALSKCLQGEARHIPTIVAQFSCNGS